MNLLRKALLGLYQSTTAGSRERSVRWRALDGRAPVIVLFYHRVADVHPNRWTIPIADFTRQIDWLAERFDVVSLEAAQRRLVERAEGRPAVAITFDDGYADNCDAAVPLLLRRGLPFTYFVATGIVRDQTAFPHDLEAGVRLAPNTVEQLRAMADAGVDVGAHTRTHPDLGRSTDPDWLQEEIKGSMDDVEEWTGRRPRHFAFPFGLPANMTPAAFCVAREAGAEAVCSAYGAYNLPERVPRESGAFHLRRVHADPEWERFVNWMTFDPRKLAAADPIDDEAYLAPTMPEAANG